MAVSTRGIGRGIKRRRHGAGSRPRLLRADGLGQDPGTQAVRGPNGLLVERRRLFRGGAHWRACAKPRRAGTRLLRHGRRTRWNRHAQTPAQGEAGMHAQGKRRTALRWQRPQPSTHKERTARTGGFERFQQSRKRHAAGMWASISAVTEHPREAGVRRLGSSRPSRLASIHCNNWHCPRTRLRN